MLILVGLLLGWNHAAVADNFGEPLDAARNVVAIVPGLTAVSAFGLFVAICVSQTGSLFASDAWNNITYTAGEVKDPRRNIPLSLALGTVDRHRPVPARERRLSRDAAVRPASSTPPATAWRRRSLNAIFPGARSRRIMAVGIMISTFGCTNVFVLACSRAYYAMARDGLFFRACGRLNARRVPAWGLVLQGSVVRRSSCCRAPTIRPRRTYGNLYGNLLDYVISAALIFYILTIAGIFRLRRTRPDAERPYRAFGYPFVQLLYIAGAAAILVVLFVYRPATTWPGLVIVLLGVPVISRVEQSGESVNVSRHPHARRSVDGFGSPATERSEPQLGQEPSVAGQGPEMHVQQRDQPHLGRHGRASEG